MDPWKAPSLCPQMAGCTVAAECSQEPSHLRARRGQRGSDPSHADGEQGTAPDAVGPMTILSFSFCGVGALTGL